MEYIDPKDTALEIAVKMQADKLIYLSRYPGIYTDETRSDVYPRITSEEVEELKKTRHFPEDFMDYLNHCMDAVHQGVNRAHILDGRIPHSLLLEIFTNKGIGTAILKDDGEKYYNEHE